MIQKTMAARGVDISADDGTGITVTGNWYFSTALVTDWYY